MGKTRKKEHKTRMTAKMRLRFDYGGFGFGFCKNGEKAESRKVCM